MTQFLVDVKKDGRQVVEATYGEMVRNLSFDHINLIETAENALTQDQREEIAQSPLLRSAQLAFRAMMKEYHGVDLSSPEGISYPV